ncbi:hypothetical protein [Paraburkholderia antibiotica]|uniref:Uncharacterized protein n=1 Tax=Paraburkholderia antibiotica TaxID=2728839 RepID=A0A7Y0FGT6_9BURK|nr:hypothetical protein [Paraburkholderia antibiotica]NML35360.1 hypothetical protein [Paraburkholderia antibiotica]
MSDRQTAFITFYDEATGQVKFCVVPRPLVQTAIDRVISITVPPDAPEHPAAPFTDEDARELGGMAIMSLAGPNPELRSRLQISTETPLNWSHRDRVARRKAGN